MQLRLTAHEVTFAYEGGHKPAVDEASLEVRGGEVLGLIGPNGAGKSTLLRLSAGLLSPQAGRIELDGRALGEFSRRERARCIGFLPQMTPWPRGVTGEEIVALGRHPHQRGLGILSAHDLAVVRSSLERTDAVEIARRPFSHLSGGERQRVLIASVLAQEASILLLDEPTTALDLHHAWAIMRMLRGFAREEGMGIVVVMHDLNLAGGYCDRLMLMQGGSLRREGVPGEVLTEDALRPVYGPEVIVDRHPRTGAPLVTVAPIEAEAATC